MTDKIMYWATVIFASLALLLFAANATLIDGNQKLQADIAQRQNVIGLANTVAPLSQQLSQALFDASVKTNDGKLRELLLSQGYKLPEAQKAESKAADPKASAKTPNKPSKTEE